MQTSSYRVLAFLQVAFAYRRVRFFAWNPKTRYALRCSDAAALTGLLEDAPWFERLSWI